MKTNWTGRPIKSAILALVFAVVIAAIIGGLSEGVHELWNWLMPAIFKLPSIGFWQAVGLLALSWILFGGFGWLGQGSRGRTVSRRRMAERWAQMSPQEQAMARGGLRGHCGQPATGAEHSEG
jgi:uncharacterized membrane protein YbhN (UPF0104 family)